MQIPPRLPAAGGDDPVALAADRLVLYSGFKMNKCLTGEPLPAIDGENLRRIHEVLLHYPDIRRVWIFGSFARGRRPDWRSDLDLAVEGLPADLQARLWSELDQAISIPVDVVRWETAGALLRAEIHKWGKLLYET